MSHRGFTNALCGWMMMHGVREKNRPRGCLAAVPGWVASSWLGEEGARHRRGKRTNKARDETRPDQTRPDQTSPGAGTPSDSG